MASLQALFLLVLAIATQTLAQNPAAPSPAPSPTNLTGILDKAGQFTTLIRLLQSTQVNKQVAIQLNSSTDGLTVFAPTDNAFQNLKPGTINSLTQQQQDQLIQYHVIPKFYTLANFQTISNPVHTQAGAFGLNIIYVANNQVNVSTGVVRAQVQNTLSDKSPLAVYQVDKVLLPEEMFGAKAPASSPASEGKAKGESAAPKADVGPADQGSSNGGYGVRSMGMGFVFGLGLATIGFLS